MIFTVIICTNNHERSPVYNHFGTNIKICTWIILCLGGAKLLLIGQRCPSPLQKLSSNHTRVSLRRFKDRKSIIRQKVWNNKAPADVDRVIRVHLSYKSQNLRIQPVSEFSLQAVLQCIKQRIRIKINVIDRCFDINLHTPVVLHKLYKIFLRWLWHETGARTKRIFFCPKSIVRMRNTRDRGHCLWKCFVFNFCKTSDAKFRTIVLLGELVTRNQF